MAAAIGCGGVWRARENGRGNYSDAAQRYFDSIKAPQKQYVLLPNTGHDPNAAMIDAQYNLPKNGVVSLVK